MGLLASIYGYGQTYAAPTGGVNPAGTGGTDNLHLGHSAGADPLNAASQNVFVGTRAGEENETGTHNTFTGYQAGENNVFRQL